MDQFCPECGGEMLYDIQTKRFSCKKCGLYITREELRDLRYKLMQREEDPRKKRAKEHSDYLEWWLSGNKEK